MRRSDSGVQRYIDKLGFESMAHLYVPSSEVNGEVLVHVEDVFVGNVSLLSVIMLSWQL